LITNLTNFAIGHLAWKDKSGSGRVVCVVKASYGWNDRGVATVLASTDPLLEADEYADEPATSGLLQAAELGPPKQRIDVLLSGELVFPAPTTEATATLEVGRRLRKTVSVLGDRTWLPGVNKDVVPSRPKPVTRVPIAWEKSFGGTDPKDPATVDRRNPVGSGIRKDPADLVGQPAPSFEDPAKRVRSWKDRPNPQGFGPVAPHWLPRAKLAGTFDERWQEERKPLLPEDFDPAYFNVAPADQQLDKFVPGEEVRLTSMTLPGRDRFFMPDLNVPVLFVAEKMVLETAVEVDTITIFPARRQFSLVARASFSPRPTILSLRQIVVGVPTPGRRKAIQTGRTYLDWRSARPKTRT
jgi:hypothetical protein